MKKTALYKFEQNRRGVTLTEVLMAMLIMSIGVSFVAAVFPISVLRSIQASQLTTGTIHRYTAEAMIDVYPDLVLNPDGFGFGAGPNLVHEGGGGDDEPGQQYAEHRGQKYIVDPWGYHTHLKDGTLFDRQEGPDGAGNTVNGVEWARWFGVDSDGFSGVQRFDGGITALNPNPGGIDPVLWARQLEHFSSQLAASSDRWDKVIDTEDVVPEIVGGVVVGVTFGPDIDLTMLIPPPAPTPGVADRELGRVTVFDPLGRQSQTYPITQIVGQTVLWTEDLDGDGNLDTGEDFNANGGLDSRALPGRISAVGHVTVEQSQARLFSWIIGVRNETTQVKIEVAVLFNRGVSPEREHAYRATFIGGTNLVGVEYDSAVEPEPFIKKGGYVFNVEHCVWHRIQNVLESPPEYPEYEFVLAVEPFSSSLSSGEDLSVMNQALDPGEDVDSDGVVDFGRAVFLPGIIEVYPLGSMRVPEELQ